MRGILRYRRTRRGVDLGGLVLTVVNIGHRFPDRQQGTQSPTSTHKRLFAAHLRGRADQSLGSATALCAGADMLIFFLAASSMSKTL